MNRTPVLVIDADPAVYQAGFAAQNTSHHYVYQTASGELRQRIWADGNKALRFFRSHPKCEVLSHETEVDVKPEGFARQAAKTILNKCVKAGAEKFGCGRNDIQIEVVLSGPDNFRKEIATIKEYKANRKAALPVHYNVVRSYIANEWNAHTVHGWEADDEVSIRCRQLQADGVPWLLATIDKDLDQVPGPHFDYQKNKHYDVADSEAHQLFWIQLVAGDSTDNIQGCYRIGMGAAEKLVGQWVEEFEGSQAQLAHTLDEYLWACSVEKYAENMGKYPDKFPEGMTAEEAALENARLVFMLEHEGQLWTPPGMDDETLWTTSSKN